MDFNSFTHFVACSFGMRLMIAVGLSVFVFISIWCFRPFTRTHTHTHDPNKRFYKIHKLFQTHLQITLEYTYHIHMLLRTKIVHDYLDRKQNRRKRKTIKWMNKSQTKENKPRYMLNDINNTEIMSIEQPAALVHTTMMLNRTEANAHTYPYSFTRNTLELWTCWIFWTEHTLSRWCCGGQRVNFVRVMCVCMCV